MRVISLGAGVQSSVLVFAACLIVDDCLRRANSSALEKRSERARAFEELTQ